MREILTRLLALSPLPAVVEARNHDALRVLAFHRVDRPERFRRLVEILVERYVPVDLDRVLDQMTGHRKLPDRAVLVTFDDGHPTVLRNALPILTDLGVPAVLFVVSELIDSQRLPWWEEVEQLTGGDGASLVRELKELPDRERRQRIESLRGRLVDKEAPRTIQLTADDLRRLDRSGIEVANHTRSHPILTRCDIASAEREIREAHAHLAGILGRPPRAFAFPNGDHDPRVEPILASLGYRAAFLFDHRLTRVEAARRFSLSRLRLDADAAPERLKLTLSGLHPALYHLRRRLRLL